MEEHEDKHACLDAWFVIEVMKAKMHKRSKMPEIDVLKIYDKIKDYWDPYLPQPVVGEVVNYLLNQKDLGSEEFMSALAKLTDLLREVKMEPLSWDAIEIAKKLGEDEKWLKPTDAIIVGMALADEECTWLVTVDRVMRESLAITRVDKELVENGSRRHPLKVGLNH